MERCGQAATGCGSAIARVMEATIALEDPESRAAQAPSQSGPQSARVRHLLAVARAEFVAGGFDAVSIDAIARASGVSKETIYRYFPDKEALFRAAAEELGTEFTARVNAQPVDARAADDGLAFFSRAILDAAVDGGFLSAAWITISIARLMPDFAESMHDVQSNRLEPIRALLQAIAEAHGESAHVPLDFAVLFGSLSSESPALLMGFPSPPPAQRDVAARRVAKLFGHGILAMDDMGAQRFPVPAAPPAGDAPPAHIAKLLDVAATHFLQNGYQGASLDLIGAEAAVGRGTLYRHFGNKAGLFGAAMRAMARRLTAAVPPPLPAGEVAEEALARFLQASLQVLGGADSILLHRTVIAEMRRDPELARDVYAILRNPWLAPLTAWLDSLEEAGKVRVHDRPWYARQALVLAFKGTRVVAAGKALGPSEMAGAARRAAAIFLRGFTAAL